MTGTDAAWAMQRAGKEEAAQVTKQYRFGPVLCLGAFVLSFASEVWSGGLCLVMPMIFALWHWLFRRLR